MSTSIGIDRSHCECGVADGCGPASEPICSLPPGAADPPVLSTSPATAFAAGQRAVQVNPATSLARFALGTASASTRVGGTINIYTPLTRCEGGCGVRLDGVLAMDPFTIGGHSLRTVTLTLGGGNNIFNVGADGVANVPAGAVEYFARAVYSDERSYEVTGRNPEAFSFRVNWRERTFEIRDAGLALAKDLNGTLGVSGRFQTALLEAVAAAGEGMRDEALRPMREARLRMATNCVDRPTVASGKTGQRAIPPDDLTVVRGTLALSRPAPVDVDVSLEVVGAPAGVELTPATARIAAGGSGTPVEVRVQAPFVVGEIELVARLTWLEGEEDISERLAIRSAAPLGLKDEWPSCDTEARMREFHGEADVERGDVVPVPDAEFRPILQPPFDPLLFVP